MKFLGRVLETWRRVGDMVNLGEDGIYTVCQVPISCVTKGWKVENSGG